MKNLILLLLATLFSFASPAAIGPILHGDTSTCVGVSWTMADTTAGGIWTSSNTAIATIGSASGVFTAVSVGTATITYTVGASYVTATVAVSPAPGPIIVPTAICMGSTAVFSDAVPGGGWDVISTYTMPIGDGGFSVGGLFFPTVWGNVNVIYIAPGGCIVVGSAFIYQTPPPITGPSIVHVGSTITLSDTISGGGHAWSSGNTSIATVNAVTGVVTGVAVGTVTIYFSPATPYVYGYSDSCLASYVVTVMPPTEVPGLTVNNMDITLYPNPATTELTLQSGQPMNEVTITDLIGQPVYRKSLTANCQLLTVNVADLPVGIYLLQVNGPGSYPAVRKFVKE